MVVRNCTRVGLGPGRPRAFAGNPSKQVIRDHIAELAMVPVSADLLGNHTQRFVAMSALDPRHEDGSEPASHLRAIEPELLALDRGRVAVGSCSACWTAPLTLRVAGGLSLFDPGLDLRGKPTDGSPVNWHRQREVPFGDQFVNC